MKIVFLTLLAAMLFVGCNNKSVVTSSEPKEVVAEVNAAVAVAVAEVNATVADVNVTAPVAK